MFALDHFKAVMESSSPPRLEDFSFPDPSLFLAGDIHRRVDLWDKVLA